MKLSKRHTRGFTLIELLIVMTVIGILASIAVPSYQRSLIKADEAVLMEDLYQMRRALDAFFADKRVYPGGLSELVDARYLRSIPVDPTTDSAETWKCVAPEPTEDGVLSEGGCFDVKSGSDKVGLNGIPYNEW